MILWDCMLLITVLYFHMMIEKGNVVNADPDPFIFLFASAGEWSRSSSMVRSLQVYLQAKFFSRIARRRII